MFTNEEIETLRQDKEQGWIKIGLDLMESKLTISDYAKALSLPDATVRRWANFFWEKNPEAKEEYDRTLKGSRGGVKPNFTHKPKTHSLIEQPFEEDLETLEPKEEPKEAPKGNLSNYVKSLAKTPNKQNFTIQATKDLFDLMRAIAMIEKTTIKECMTNALVEYCQKKSDKEIREAIDLVNKYLK